MDSWVRKHAQFWVIANVVSGSQWTLIKDINKEVEEEFGKFGVRRDVPIRSRRILAGKQTRVPQNPT